MLSRANYSSLCLREKIHLYSGSVCSKLTTYQIAIAET